ncbi:MAG: Uma2 family endonuclease [Planctomycetota bacterium]|nr:Uma2 family endonuclease [Planctomycetota bacterium]
MSETEIYPTSYLDLPTSDDQPMAETDGHALEMTEFLRDVLRDHYAEEPMVYVASNNFLYYDPGNVKKNVSPDCYVIKGIPKRLRDSYQAWAEGGALPNLIFELTSHSTWRVDMEFKRDLYQSWGCQEYFLYDLTADRILNHLLGYRLVNGVYEEMAQGIHGRLFSEELQLELAHHEGHLRFFISGSKQPIATRWEEIRQQKLLAEEEHLRAEEERARADEQRVRADEEKARADRADLELKRLKEEMAKLREGNP